MPFWRLLLPVLCGFKENFIFDYTLKKHIHMIWKTLISKAPKGPLGTQQNIGSQKWVILCVFLLPDNRFQFGCAKNVFNGIQLNLCKIGVVTSISIFSYF